MVRHIYATSLQQMEFFKKFAEKNSKQNVSLSAEVQIPKGDVEWLFRFRALFLTASNSTKNPHWKMYWLAHLPLSVCVNVSEQGEVLVNRGLPLGFFFGPHLLQTVTFIFWNKQWIYFFLHGCSNSIMTSVCLCVHFCLSASCTKTSPAVGLFLPCTETQ